MENTIKPIYLLADSTPLFDKNHAEQYFLADINSASSSTLKAAYIGASNGDNPDFYDLFVQAMKNIKVEDCFMIKSAFDDDDKKNLESADIILLAGGDVKLGWDTINSTGMQKVILERFHNGATLIGVSAGARHLSWQSLGSDNDDIEYLMDTLKMVPFCITTGDGTKELKTVMKLSESMKKGMVIPPGGMIIYYADNTVSSIRKAAEEIIYTEEGFKSALIMPEEATKDMA